MSTRSHIIVKDKNSTHYVYHHHDGYLEGVGKELKEYIPQFIKLVKDGEEKLEAHRICQFLEDNDSEYEFEDVGIHGDEEYVYYITISDNYSNICLAADDYINHTRLTDYTENYIAGNPVDTTDDLTEILSSIVSEFFRSSEGKKVLRESINKYFDKK